MPRRTGRSGSRLQSRTVRVQALEIWRLCPLTCSWLRRFRRFTLRLEESSFVSGFRWHGRYQWPHDLHADCCSEVKSWRHVESYDQWCRCRRIVRCNHPAQGRAGSLATLPARRPRSSSRREISEAQHAIRKWTHSLLGQNCIHTGSVHAQSVSRQDKGGRSLALPTVLVNWSWCA